MIGKVYSVLRSRGPVGLWRAVRDEVHPAGRLAYPRAARLFQGETGLEIGGPSPIFGPRGVLPIYGTADRIDNCNFAAETTWEGDIREGETFVFSPRRRPGRQFVAEATDLGRFEDGAYDFLLSSHAIEHTANPLKALGEWIRVVKPGGLFAIIVPHAEGTFDHRRPVTPLSHLIEDQEANVTEADLTHLDEILALHDFGRDPGGGDAEIFRARSLRNVDNRCLHQHVFDTASAVAMVEHAGLGIFFVQALAPHDIVILARKPATGEPRAEPVARPPWRSVFGADQAGPPS